MPTLVSNGLGDQNIHDLEMSKFAVVGTAGTAGTIAVKVINPDGSSIGSSGGGGGGTIPDQSAFSSGTTQGNLVMGVYQASPDTISSGSMAAVGIDTNRNMNVRENYAPVAEDNLSGVYGQMSKAVPGTSTVIYGPSSYQNLGGSVTDTVQTIPTYVYSIYASNINAAIRYLQAHDITTATIPTGGTPRYTWLMAGGTQTLSQIYNTPLTFGTGCAFGWSTVAGTMAPATAGDHTLQVRYK